ncbi:hypothetical protein CEXT_271341 [Caerostris extrusa]|uniref:Uncharacterized protein n=1 Tax=Caerostris extrusa TaxID=172846 RepID=A0AAV4U1V3_CAEEX|nr:hypothetical protein CEXT_271341 [Caerostris extrusa]
MAKICHHDIRVKTSNRAINIQEYQQNDPSDQSTWGQCSIGDWRYSTRKEFPGHNVSFVMAINSGMSGNGR